MGGSSVVEWLSSAPFLHLAGIAAVAALLGVGVIPVSEGFPILTGLVGLGINTSPGPPAAVPSSRLAQPAAVAPAARPVAVPNAQG